MAANRFDQAAQMPVVNTYVPIDFNQLYRIGATQKAAVDQAIADIGTAVQSFGEFRSPSRVDTEKYYDMTLGRMQDLIDEMASNPDSIKDANVRSRFYGRLNSLDYAGLSLLKESADNLRKGEAMRAEMQAKGLYNKNWDDSDIATYDTLGSGRVFSDITPVAYMNANQLSNPYFDNLSKGTIGTTWKDGARYIVTGNTVDDLRAVADARYNDLVNTPQGQKYYQQFLRENNGDAAAAESAFKDMIVASQMDRTLRPTLTVDPAWLASLKASYSRGAGNAQTESTPPTRLDLINTGVTERNYQIFKSNMNKYYTPEQQKQLNDNILKLNQEYQLAEAQYYKDPTDDNFLAARKAEDLYNRTRYGIISEVNRKVMLDTFQDTAKFSADKGEKDSQYTRENYRIGVQAALDQASAPLSTMEKDRIFTLSNGTFTQWQNESGTSVGAYDYNNSNGFLLPETVFSGITGVTPREGKREDWSLLGDTKLAFKQLFEGGNLKNVTFVPGNKAVRAANGQLAALGSVRIPVDEIEEKVGTGMLNYKPGLFYAGFLPTKSLFGTESTERALKQLYGAEKVKRKVGNDDVEYFEFEAYKLLPPEDGTAAESNTAIDQAWMNTNTYGGIGTSTLAGDNYYNSASRALNLQ